MQGNPPGMGYGSPSNPSGPATQNVPPAPMPPGAAYVAPPPRPSRFGILLGAIAVVLAAAALVVSLVRKPETSAAEPATATATAAPILPPQELFVEDADRALCQAIAPLMKEASDRNLAFGPLTPGSPEQGAAIPEYRAFIEGWADRIQEILNQHLNPPRYLSRTLQDYIDDNLLYVELVQPGKVDAFDRPTWIQGAVDYGGPLATCTKLGVSW